MGPYPSASYSARPSARSRATAGTLSLAILVAVILALLWAGRAQFREPPSGTALATFDVTSGERRQATARRQIQRQPQPRTAPRRPDEPRAAPTPPEPVSPLPDFMRMSRADFAATDIGRMKRLPGSADAGTETAAAGGPTSAGIPGAAPGGETLYPAEWYREPSRAEMATYMPARATEGWGMIMCRTIDRYHVEDCREMGETPGSGLARAMRQAAFQFLVRPPQVNGKSQVGTWVRIRFDVVRGIAR